MLKLHGRAAALALGGILAVGLPAGLVLAASSHDALGGAVSTIAKSTATMGEDHGDAVSTAARGSHGTSDAADRDEPATDASAPADVPPVGTHGSAVSMVARDQSAVGGAHDNHGGAVSAVARQNAGAGGTPPTTGHGTAVSAAARSTETTGEAHGDAVAAAARPH